MPVLIATTPRSRVAAFVALMKLRIIELLLVTTVPVMVVAAEGLPSLGLVVATVVGGTLAAGGANALNMIVDRDIDALMERTKGRPLVTGEITPTEALVFALGIELAAFLLLWWTVNLLSASLAVAATAFYVGVYTIWLKRTSTQNIVIGGAAGAAPPVIGWTAVTNSIGIEAIVLFLIVFFWTPPHFWALAVRYADDYAAADVPMLPAVATPEKVARQILAYSVVVWISSLVFWQVADRGWIYLAAAVAVGALFTGGAVSLARETDPEARSTRAIRYFAFSITHLTVLFSAMAVDELVGWGVG